MTPTKTRAAIAVIILALAAEVIIGSFPVAAALVYGAVSPLISGLTVRALMTGAENEADNAGDDAA